MKIVKYTVIHSYSPGNLTAQVNQLIDQGWQPLGGVSSGMGDDGNLYFNQAIVMYEKD